jgi:hypothetical protein
VFIGNSLGFDVLYNMLHDLVDLVLRFGCFRRLGDGAQPQDRAVRGNRYFSAPADGQGRWLCHRIFVVVKRFGLRTDP